MHQELLTNQFRNVKRKSSILANKKIANLNGNTINKSNINLEDDIEKPQKMFPETLLNLNKTETLNNLPLKRKSSRNRKSGEEFEAPKNLVNNKKIELEKNIAKKRKREEECINNISETKKKLLKKNKNLNKTKNETRYENVELEESLDIEKLDSSMNTLTNDEKKIEFEKSNKNNFADITGKTLKKGILINNDVSEKTKALLNNIMKRKSQVNSYEENLKIKSDHNTKVDSERNFKKSFKNSNKSTEKNYISDDVLDQFEESLKNKNSKDIVEKMNGKYKRSNKNINNIAKNDSDINGIKENDSNLNQNNSTNTSCLINNSREIETPYKFNKMNYNFSFENEKTDLICTREKNKKYPNIDINNTQKDGKSKNLLLSTEANPKEFKVPILSENALKVIRELKQEQRENNFKRNLIKHKERDRSESSFSLKFKYEELIKEERELLLPTSYKRLFVAFEHLDKTLNYFKMSKSTKIPSFCEIKKSIENTYKEYFIFHF